MSLRNKGFPGGGSRFYSMVKARREELVSDNQKPQVSRDLKISITKGKERKTRERECKKGEKRKHTGKAQYIHIVPLWFVGK